MAEKSTEASPSEPSTPKVEQNSGNWWDSWITSAKSKSAEVYSMVKKDLDEIGSAVKSEASHVFSSTSNVIGKTLKLDVPESPANAMKKSLSTFIGQVSTALSPEPDDEDDTEVILSSGDTTMLSTYKKELEALQRVDATFLVEASGPQFTAWRAGYEPPSPTALLRRLRASPELHAQYERLVPAAVDHTLFWERYSFRVALLQDRLAAASRAKRAETDDPVMSHLPLQSPPPEPIVESPKKVLSGIVTPEEVTIESPSEASELDNVVVTWEDEDFANDLELTEEQQTLLLEEYEKEITNKKVTKQNVTNNNVSVGTKTAQTRDKNNQTTAKKDKKTGKNKSPKKSGKSDVCGNNLVEDYFGDKEVKDDDTNSDESWEKEFEIDDVEQKA